MKFNSNRCHSRFSFPSFRILMICYCHPFCIANPPSPLLQLCVCSRTLLCRLPPQIFLNLPSHCVELFTKTVTRRTAPHTPSPLSYHCHHPFHVYFDVRKFGFTSWGRRTNDLFVNVCDTYHFHSLIAFFFFQFLLFLFFAFRLFLFSSLVLLSFVHFPVPFVGVGGAACF